MLATRRPARSPFLRSKATDLPPKSRTSAPRMCPGRRKPNCPRPGEYRSCRYLPALIHTISFLYINNTWAPARKSKRRAPATGKCSARRCWQTVCEKAGENGESETKSANTPCRAFSMLDPFGQRQAAGNRAEAPARPDADRLKSWIRRRMSKTIVALSGHFTTSEVFGIISHGGKLGISFAAVCPPPPCPAPAQPDAESRRCRADMARPRLSKGISRRWNGCRWFFVVKLRRVMKGEPPLAMRIPFD